MPLIAWPAFGRRRSHLHSARAGLSPGWLAPLAAALVGCSSSGLGSSGPGGPLPDLGVALGFPDSGSPPLDPCVDAPTDPRFHTVLYAPPSQPFPLQSDATPSPLESDSGVAVDARGFLGAYKLRFTPNYGYIPNHNDNNSAGTVSKIDAATVREVARYPTVTCYSLPGGSKAKCDGTTGCCSLDDSVRYAARKQAMKDPGHQPVQLLRNEPSRTAVDANGDLLIANQASNDQGSVTRIASDLSECVDRNHNGRLDTSRDSNGDGYIQTDCNGDGFADDLASVWAQPCVNKLQQEYYGPDDECVLWTTNVFAPSAAVRALAKVPGESAGTSDVWAGAQHTGDFVRSTGSPVSSSRTRACRRSA